MSDNYWQSLVSNRMSRRRALAVAGGGSAAAFLAACGGGSDCHSAQGIGCYCTCFERSIETSELLLAELHAGRFLPGRDLPSRELSVFTEAWALTQE